MGEQPVVIDLMKALKDSLRRRVVCKRCGGTGWLKERWPSKCDDCNGTGSILPDDGGAMNSSERGEAPRQVGWWEEYRCGCVSETVKLKRELPGYCPQHGEDSRGPTRDIRWQSKEAP